MSVDLEQSGYSLLHASQALSEQERLDQLHNAITEYFGGRLSLAPLEDLDPSSILELGAGSGAWAIAAALQFPNAHVTAADLQPLPSRSIPPNMSFQQVDITKELPFAPASFDAVHLRLVFFHLRGAEEVMKRIFDLLKPGGWLLIEDSADNQTLDGLPVFGPGMNIGLSSFITFARRKGADTDIARRFQTIISDSCLFDQVYFKSVPTPHTPWSSNAALNKLGRIWKDNVKRVARDLASQNSALGFTEELAQVAADMLDDASVRTAGNLYVVWARKRLVE